MNAEDPAGEEIDQLHAAAGLLVEDADEANLQAARGVPPRDFPLESGYVTDEAHHIIHNLRRQVLECFDAHLIGLTATPNKDAFGFFTQNLAMEYGHPLAVADGADASYNVYRIKTEATGAGSKGEAGYWLQALDMSTRARRDWQLDDDFEYAPEELDRSVQTPDQIRTVARTLRHGWQADFFSQRQELPKTLVFANDHNHAEVIVGILREEWGPRNEFAQMTTYGTMGSKPEELIKAFRATYYSRITVTVGEPRYHEDPEDGRASERAGSLGLARPLGAVQQCYKWSLSALASSRWISIPTWRRKRRLTGSPSCPGGLRSAAASGWSAGLRFDLSACA